jgi:hypothetical protein
MRDQAHREKAGANELVMGDIMDARSVSSGGAFADTRVFVPVRAS